MKVMKMALVVGVAVLAGCATRRVVKVAGGTAEVADAKPIHYVAQYVNPLVGTDYNGHVFPGACWPMGLVQASPDTGHGTWDYTGGYRNSDKSILGFSQTHLSAYAMAVRAKYKFFSYGGCMLILREPGGRHV